MIEKINDWLKAPKGKYSFGVGIFLALGSVEVKKKYSDYFRTDENEDVALSDPRFPMLINKVTAIYNIIKMDPEKYAEALAKLAAPLIKTNESVKKIITLKDEIQEMQSKIDDLEDLEENKDLEIEELQEELEKKHTEIDELKELLKARGLKVMDSDDLPAGTLKKYNRVKDIVPLMAAIHAELKDTTLTDEQRKEKAEQLCELDDERRTLWDDIDTYLNDYNSELTEENQFEYSDDPIIKGMQMGNRLKRLKENVKRTKESIDRHIQNNKPDQEEKSRERLAKYEIELNELLEQLGEKN